LLLSFPQTQERPPSPPPPPRQWKAFFNSQHSPPPQGIPLKSSSPGSRMIFPAANSSPQTTFSLKLKNLFAAYDEVISFLCLPHTFQTDCSPLGGERNFQVLPCSSPSPPIATLLYEAKRYSLLRIIPPGKRKFLFIIT